MRKRTIALLLGLGLLGLASQFRLVKISDNDMGPGFRPGDWVLLGPGTARKGEWTIQLVMAIRLLWSEDQGLSKVYRGVPGVDLGIYQRAKSAGTLVQWEAFSSTSTIRNVAMEFAGEGGTVFVIRRDPKHAAAADVSEYSSFPRENEILLLPRMRFRVLDIHLRDRYSEVVLEEMRVYPTAL